MSASFREKVVTFGDRGGLVGILTIPTEQRADAPHVVLINSGLIHRVGANRLYVSFARAFAAAGITTLRFDLSGIGDSERNQSSPALLQEAVEGDIAAAVDCLHSKHGASQFVLAGLCSGAFDSFSYALRDQRISGAVMLDMPGPFRNWSHTVNHIAVRVFRPSSWRNLFRALARATRALMHRAESGSPSAETVTMPGVRGHRSRSRMEAELDALLARNVKLSFIFTGGMLHSYNHRSQFRLLFPRAAAHADVSVEFLRWSDHSFSTRNARAHVASIVRDWLLAHTTGRLGN